MKITFPSFPIVIVKVEQPFHLILSLSIVIPLIIAFAINTRAADTASVSATVTAQSLSVGVSDTNVSYSTMSAGTSSSTIAGDLDDSHVLTNDGNVAEDFNIKGMDSTSVGTTWALGASPNSEVYAHKYCIGTATDCDSSPSWVASTTSYAQLTDSAGVGDTQWFDLQLSTPSSTTDFNEQTVNITIQAVAD